LYRHAARFAWDPGKSVTNLAKRGFDFAFATLIFDGPTLEQEDRRKDYGERRIVAVGVAQRVHLTVVYTDRVIGGDEVERRIVSARRSNGHERKAYQASLSQG
jgi:hypothetical protein